MHAVLVLLMLFGAAPQEESCPQGSKLTKLVKKYLETDPKGRLDLRRKMDARYKPLTKGSAIKKYRKDVLKIVMKQGPRLELKGTHDFYPERKKGKYIAEKKGKTLFIGLHGGGVGSGSAESSANAMGGGGWTWIFPEVLEKTECGWTTSGTEEFVVELVLAAKRTKKIDPNRIYITGHSMGGYGAWTLGAHHADLFAGAAAYAGAPTPYFKSPGDHTIVGIVDGVIPSLYNLPLLVFQSTDDPQVPPGPNDYAVQELEKIKKKHPKGFNFRYVRVENRGHSAPSEGYLPTQEWLASFTRNPRPKKILWQPVLEWKKQFYWLYWENPIEGAWIQAEVKKDNLIELQAELEGKPLSLKDLKNFSLLIGPPLIDLKNEVRIKLNQKEVFCGRCAHRLSTILLTAPHCDEEMLYDARIVLKSL